MKTSAELRDELRQAEMAEAEERKARRAAVKKKWLFTMLPTDNSSMFDRILDPSIRMYTLRGTILNSIECTEAGYSSDEVKAGGMNYLFNTLSSKIVMQCGGGHVYLKDSSWSRTVAERKQNAEEFAKAVNKLNEFLTKNPEGGDVTSIILGQKGFSW